MTRPVSSPFYAALGLVPTVFGGVRRLPGKVVQIPVLAISSALTTLDATRRGYDDLADRGERLVARLRGVSLDDVEDRVEDALQGTSVAGLYDRVEDTLEDVVEDGGRALRSVRGGASKAARNAEEAAEDAASAVQDGAEAAATLGGQAAGAAARAGTTAAGAAAQAGTTAAGAAAQAGSKAAGQVEEQAEAETPEAEQPKGRPTPRATQPDDTRVSTAASPEVVQTVEQVAAGAGGGEVLAHDELPLADYDHMTLGSLRGRMRSLTVTQLVQLRDYEKAHANRLPVVTMLDNRIAKLSNDPSAAPTGKTSAPVPELQPSQVARGGSKVSPATGGPAQNPPSQGVPTNPAQPRTTGSPGTNPNSSA